jgi:hypothetical protein
MRSGSGEGAVGFLLLVNVLHFIPAASERLITFNHTEADIGRPLEIEARAVGERVGAR